jgi:hypothetical protein
MKNCNKTTIKIMINTNLNNKNLMIMKILLDKFKKLILINKIIILYQKIINKKN